MTKHVETAGEARLALRTFLKHAIKNLKKAHTADDDILTAMVLTDLLKKIPPYYEVSMKLAGYEIPNEEENTDGNSSND